VAITYSGETWLSIEPMQNPDMSIARNAGTIEEMKTQMNYMTNSSKHALDKWWKGNENRLCSSKTKKIKSFKMPVS